MTTPILVTLPPEDSQKLYQIYRQYVMNEADLINARLTWLLTIQGFLFATYGIIVASQKPWVTWALSVLRWLPGYGVVVSLVALASILAARFAADAVFEKWEKLPHSDTFKDLMPKIRGGGHPKAHILGYFAPVGIPLTLCAIWVVLFCLSRNPGPSESCVNV
jgi:hypothetical protein